MGGSNATIRGLTQEGIPFAMELKTIAGWNQTEEDLRRYIAPFPARRKGKPDCGRAAKRT